MYDFALPVGVASNVVTAWLREFRLQVYSFQRRNVIFRLAEPTPERPHGGKVCIAIAHVVSEDEARDPVLAAPKIERMQQVIDGLLMSFANCELVILVRTLPNRNIVHFLPQYQQSRIELIETPACDPPLVGFRVQEELIARIDDHDWFMFLEDDTVIHDASFLYKIQEFQQSAGPRDLLMPHRYEYVDGVKRYIDLIIDGQLAWNKVSALNIRGLKFSECSNPHSAIYCLTKEQLRIWERSGRTWQDRTSLVGPLESAATYCLLECFHLYKPHPSNLTYLEVRHWDTKYSRLYPKPENPYTLDPVRANA